MTTFKRNEDARVGGTSLAGYVDVSPARLIEVFGAPAEADEFKVSMTYTFEDAEGRIFTVYDWKATTLYGGTRLTPSALRRQTEPFPFHIGAHSGVPLSGFVAWLEDRCAATSAAPDCPECKGTGKYTGGLHGFSEPCSFGCPAR